MILCELRFVKAIEHIRSDLIFKQQYLPMSK